MLISMTGFGRAIVASSVGQIIIEIQSLNRRFLESNVFLPKELLSCEILIRKCVSEKITRGQITIRVQIVPNQNISSEDFPDLKILSEIKKKWEKIAHNLDLDKGDINLNFLLKQVEIYQQTQWKNDKEKLESALVKGLHKAIKELILMRKKEGKALSIDMLERLTVIEKKFQIIEKKAPTSVKRHQERLMKHLEGLASEEDERVLKEIAIYADRIDISEEILRFSSHIKQLFDLIQGKEISSGRKMEFLLQEVFREMNTIGVKSTEIEIAKKVIEIKTELEKIREQVQNIE